MDSAFTATEKCQFWGGGGRERVTKRRRGKQNQSLHFPSFDPLVPDCWCLKTRILIEARLDGG